MEFGKSYLLNFFFVVLALALSVGALKCFDGAQSWGVDETTCDPSNKFCVLWADYSFDDVYAFCDDTNMCSSVGYTNYTYYGVTCCNSDDCNVLPTPSPSKQPPVTGWVTVTTPKW